MKPGACACSLCQIPNLQSLPAETRMELMKLAFIERPKASAREIIIALKEKFTAKQ